MVFLWSLSDRNYPQVSRTLLCILSILNNVVVWTVSTRPVIFKSSSIFNNPLVTVPKAPITIDIIATIMFHRFFQFPSNVQVLILLFTFFHFYSVVSRYNKVHNFASSFIFCLLIFVRSGLLAEITWSFCISNSHWNLCVSFCRTNAGLSIYHLFLWSNFNFLHISQWIILSTQSCLVLYSLFTNLQHSLIMWLMVSSL